MIITPKTLTARSNNLDALSKKITKLTGEEFWLTATLFLLGGLAIAATTYTIILLSIPKP